MKWIFFLLPFLLVVPLSAQEAPDEAQLLAVSEVYCVCEWYNCIPYPYQGGWIAFVRRWVCDDEDCEDVPDAMAFDQTWPEACDKAVNKCMNWADRCDYSPVTCAATLLRLQRPSLGPDARWWPLTEPIAIIP